MGHLFLTTSNGKTIVRDPVGCGAHAMALTDEVLSGTGLTLDDLRSYRRGHGTVTEARNAVIAALWAAGRYSQSDIARFLRRTPSAVNLALRGRRAA